jgi:hypothetical protein
MMHSRKATISITNLRLRTFIGFNPDERAKKQDVVINVRIQYRPEPGALRDEVNSALDYKAIAKKHYRPRGKRQVSPARETRSGPRRDLPHRPGDRARHGDCRQTTRAAVRRFSVGDAGARNIP